MLAALVSFQASASANITLTQDGKSSYVIVLPANPIAPERTAAHELQLHLKAVASVQLPIVSETNAPANAPSFIIGRSAQLPKLAPEHATLQPDGILMRTIGKDILLTGQGERGALYAVYTFLEDVVGVRWWAPGESFLPKKSTLTVPRLDTIYNPPFARRATVYRSICNGRMAARLKLNGHGYRTPSEYGKEIQIDGATHTFSRFLPANKYFNDHPEWFGLRNGKRQGRGAQPCLTNDEMRKEMTKNALASLRRYQVPPPVISISQDDHRKYCQCDPCQAISQHEGSESGPIVHFVNAVAADIEKEFPNILVETLAYSYTRKPPRHIRPRENVLIQLCSIECNFAGPLATDPRNESFREDIEKWSEISHHLWVWDYVDSHRDYFLPHPNLRVLGPNLRFFADQNATGIFAQGIASCSVSHFNRLRNWVLSHLIWDPTRDGDELIREFLHGYYGKAGAHLEAHLNYLHDAVAQADIHLGLYHNSTHDWLKPAQLIEATRLYQQAEAAAAGDEALTGKLRRERLTLDFVWLNRWHEMQAYATTSGQTLPYSEDQHAFTKDFIEVCEKYRPTLARGLNRMRFREFAAMVQSWVRGKAKTPSIVKDLPQDQWIDIQDFRFNKHGQFDRMKLVDDPLASDGKAARMPGSHGHWSTQYWPRDEVRKLGKFRCYMSVRFETGASGGPAMSLGLFDMPNRKSVAIKRLPVHHDARNGYQFIDLGAHDLTGGKFFWAAPPNRNTNEVPAVYIDRILLVRDQ